MFALWPLLSAALGFFVRKTVIGFAVLAAMEVLITYLMPKVLELSANFTGTNSLNSAFSSLPITIWWWLNIGALDYGMPLIISAVVTRFLIRRLPVVG